MTHCGQVNAPIVSDKTCQERVCHVSLGPLSIQNCIIADNHICAGGMSGMGPCRVSTEVSQVWTQ